MFFRIPAIEVSADRPFATDALERQSTANFIAGIVSETGGNQLVLASHLPYDTGKSTFVDTLEIVLSQEQFQTVHFNAWKADHFPDPLTTIGAALDGAFSTL